MSEVDDKTEKRKRHRLKIIQEIVSSEVSYVQSLNTLVDVFIVPLQTLGTNDETRIVDQASISKLFSNVEMITRLNEKLLADLKQRVEQDWEAKGERIGDLFVQFAPYFKMYTVYTNNYEGANKLLDQLTKK